MRQNLGNAFDNVAEILPIDTTTGDLGTPIPLSGASADFFDMSTVAVNMIPEPSASALIMLGLFTWLGARRRLTR